MPARLLVASTVAALAVAGVLVARHTARAGAEGTRMPFEATAYSIEGETAAGTRAREGIVAADPDLLPLNTRIRVHGAGEYSGEYVVRDTGRAIKGREIDLYLASDREAKAFGRKSVEVEVVERGDGKPVPDAVRAQPKSKTR